MQSPTSSSTSGFWMLSALPAHASVALLTLLQPCTADMIASSSCTLPQVWCHPAGSSKSVVACFTEKRLSRPHRQAAEAILQSWLQQTAQDVAACRCMPLQQVTGHEGSCFTD